MNKSSLRRDTKEEEKRLYMEYKKKLAELRKVEKEKEAVGQVFTKGLLSIYVLYILSLGATNGNDISHKIGERTGGRWIPSTGGIYPLLKKLEKGKLIEGRWDDSKNRMQKIYTLTDLGFCELKNRKKLLKNKIEESLEVFNIVYNDLYKDSEE
ncbi:PadR family transcriptional regulator [Clostridium luticellarii]|jgi:DNA-binding PadR family transcriptional regulator|uniref:Transcriptional regulator PadR-like family protein n=1 Tax=Clostridium luticellarii TaxID=1691940 RepID=A0A2T0BNJ9_9CLOT|nr:PadR family transcriptional regulator [Clostridium luticellarii]MCI1944371.1 PadR family transcriptional regulator [Clostridium luticellarii]MCI1967491.1 PadR family transcriptional regulator [Clostridium luticellarii]MCI1995003.1 PadR family transcriptional regulator [Clostridium luticellarii]MCI2039558.1 PadR family transcriptional regulator [Clostridium luticellarii]PRR85451.1 Transcriptional regulator PadR-like family protein [Clostridium luticellarii]